MTLPVFAARLLVLGLASTVVQAQTLKAPLEKPSPAGDRIAVYQVFLARYSHGARGVVNLANRTTPLDLSDHNSDGCMAGIVLQDLPSSRSTTQPLGPEVLTGMKIKLVDPAQQPSVVQRNDPSVTIRRGEAVANAVDSAFASGLLQLSEIAFDQTRHYAVLSFSFSCGMLCGNGGTLVFQKIGSRWKATNRRCSSWVS